MTLYNMLKINFQKFKQRYVLFFYNESEELKCRYKAVYVNLNFI